MSEPQHTHGPWKVWREQTLPDGSKVLNVGDTSGWPVALVLGSHRGNANLVAAAPALLAACKELVAGLLATAKFGLNDDEVARLTRAETAIALAENGGEK